MEVPFVLLLLGWVVDIFSAGYLVGFVVAYSSKKFRLRPYTGALTITTTALIAGAGLIGYGPSLESKYSLSILSSFVKSLNITAFNYSAIAIGLLLVLFETGLAMGFISFTTVSNKFVKDTDAQQYTDKTQNKHVTRTAADMEYPAHAADYAVERVQQLNKTEMQVAELFVHGDVKKIVPKIDLNNENGYYFEDIHGLNLGAMDLRLTLDSLARKGVLNSELSDKVILCKACKSPHLQFKYMCHECKSMKLEKHKVIEHLVCGYIEKQEMFQDGLGNLKCPKCNKELKLIGSDYRHMPMLYICQDCGSMNKDPYIRAKCNSCKTVSEIDEEIEIPMYSYTSNQNMGESLRQQIKPIEDIDEYFHNRGYYVRRLPSVTGESGAKYTFDLEISSKRNRSKGVLVELLSSRKPVGIEDITKVYGKISDVDKGLIVCVIPRLTKDAYNYAGKHKIPIVEGTSVRDLITKLKRYGIEASMA